MSSKLGRLRSSAVAAYYAQLSCPDLRQCKGAAHTAALTRFCALGPFVTCAVGLCNLRFQEEMDHKGLRPKASAPSRKSERSTATKVKPQISWGEDPFL